MRSQSNSTLRNKATRDDKLYQRFAKDLEKEHKGKYVAISENGELIISKNDIELLQQALEKFGPGNFAFREIGSKTLGKWRTIFC